MIEMVMAEKQQAAASPCAGKRGFEMSSPSLNSATLETGARIAVLTLNRDDVRNELTGTGLWREIASVVEWINANDDISALVVTSAGKSFSAGGNVKDMRARSGAFSGDVYELQNKYRRGIQLMALAMHRLEVPSIAAVNGAAIGAGFDLACMCDLRIASRGATFGETFINLGIIPGDGGAWFLQRLIGYQRAAELTLSGRVFGAEEALEMGILLEVVEPDELKSRALAIAGGLASKPPQALRLTKRMLKSAQRMDLDDFLDLSAIYQGACHQTADHAEAISAFLDKRAANFTGK